MYKMWMVDRNDESKIPTKFRPLMPRPYSNPSSCSCIRNPNILQWTHPICGLSSDRREVPLVSTRWNPTPEQLQALEEMYRRGIRTPSAEQIQQIAAKLRSFGKIEGKNVFYWFQNHKARERQKKRRHLAANNNMHPPHHNHNQTPGVSRRYIEIEHHKKLPTPIKCSSTLSEDSASMQAAAAVADDIGWTHKILTADNEPSPQFVHSSSALSPNNSSLNTLTAHKPTVPQYTNLTALLPNLDTKENQTTTLQLFPIYESGGSFTREENEIFREVKTKFRPSEFIEFLPTKN